MALPDAARILLVRAVEESEPSLVDPEVILDAELGAGSLRDRSRWFASRATHIAASLPPSYQALPAMTRLVLGGVGWLLLGSALVGLATNYLGPSQSIHVLYNPIALLILWNLGVYAVLTFRSLRSRSWIASTTPQPGVAKEAARSGAVEELRTEGVSRKPPWIARWLFGRSVPAIWARLTRAAGATKDETKQLSHVARQFWSDWISVAKPLFGAATSRSLNLGAIGLALGAVAGMFVRGLFFDYTVVWRSTFITNPETVSSILRVLFTLPAALIGEPLPDTEVVASLMGPEGVSAREWIEIYAGAASLIILLPRSILAWIYSRRLRRIGTRLDLRLHDEYFEPIFQRARNERVGEIEAAIRTDVSVETGKFAASIATYICTALYDARIVPRIRRFRDEGGSLQALEDEIEAECEAFQPELEEYFPRAQAEFFAALRVAVERSVDDQASFDPAAARALESDVRGASEMFSAELGASFGRSLGDALALAFSAATALVAGTISGGFGKTMGVAIIATLAGTSGPIGFVLGALVGLIAAGGAYIVGRKRADSALKSLDLSARIARIVLPAKRMDRIIVEGRTRCRDSVEQLINEKLEPLAPQISAEIWTHVRPLIARRRVL